MQKYNLNHQKNSKKVIYFLRKYKIYKLLILLKD